MSDNSSPGQRDFTSDPSPHSPLSASSRSPSSQQRVTTSDPSIAVPAAHDATTTVPAVFLGPVQRIEGQPGALPIDPLPQVGPSLPPLDQTTIRRSLAAVETALDREGEFQALQRSYNDLLQSYFALRQRVADLEHTIRSAAQSASPFDCFVQQKYDQLSHRLAQSTLDLAETREALAQRLDNATELANLRDRMRFQDRVHAEVVADFQREIDDLERRLTAELAVASTASGGTALPPPGANPNTLQLQSQLNVAIAAQGLATRFAISRPPRRLSRDRRRSSGNRWRYSSVVRPNCATSWRKPDTVPGMPSTRVFRNDNGCRTYWTSPTKI
uniref:Uncharacterized protein n=1 Tax=Phytophthora ramorum TaxID=164328 RepID=H3H8N7_PHYRM